MDSFQLRNAIRTKYAWPGGYPMALMMLDGECICMDCAKKEYRQIARENRVKQWPDKQWTPVDVFINWEDTDLVCAHCNGAIESAYGND